jgi:hypothetical protein
MVEALLRVVGVDLQRQLARLKEHADELKDQALYEIKHQAVEASITASFAVAGLVLALLTLLVGLIALYLWVELWQGPFAALGAVAVVTSLLAALLFAVAAGRGKKPRAPLRRPIMADEPEPIASIAPGQPLTDTVSQIKDQTAIAANEVLESAADFVRKGPREAILVALIAAAAVGIVIGRRR